MAPKPVGGKSVIEKISEYLFSPFKRGEPKKTPVSGMGERLKNMSKNNFRGLIGSLVPLVVLLPQVKRFDVTLKLQLMWMLMLWFYILQPVAVPITSLIPVFLLPMGGIMNSAVTCKSYMNESIMLFILGGWLLVLINNSGADKRIAFWFLNSGDASQYCGKKMVFKTSCAAFVLSIFSNRLIATFTLTEIMTNAYGKLGGGKKVAGAPNYVAMRNVVNNAIHTSSGIGGIAIIHSSTVTLLFRGCFQELAPKHHEFPDIFNYLQYSVFAFPLAIIMFFLNVSYHMFLVDSASEKGMSVAHTTELKKLIGRESATIPAKVSLHETYSILFAFLFLMTVFFRWNKWTPGWADYTRDKQQPVIPGLKDATVAAMFCILLHILPKSFGFLKIWSAQKKSNLPPLKPESAILWWRFIDKNVNYGYIFTFGSAFSILHASTLTELDHIMGQNIGQNLTSLDWNIGILIVVVVASILCNVTTALAACSMWLPFVLLISIDGAQPWPTQVYLAALGVGVASNFGFCVPFQYTPAYYCHNTGKTPILSMECTCETFIMPVGPYFVLTLSAQTLIFLISILLIKYSIPSVIICAIVLYLALILYAPFLWDPSGVGFQAVLPLTNIPKGMVTTPAADGAAPAEPPAI